MQWDLRPRHVCLSVCVWVLKGTAGDGSQTLGGRGPRCCSLRRAWPSGGGGGVEGRGPCPGGSSPSFLHRLRARPSCLLLAAEPRPLLREVSSLVRRFTRTSLGRPGPS